MGSDRLPASADEGAHMSTVDSFGAKSTLTVGETDYEIFRIDSVRSEEHTSELQSH